MNFHQTCQCFGQVPFIRAFVCAVLLVVANLRKMEPDPVVLTTAPTIIPLGNTKGGTLTVSTFNFHFLLFWGVFVLFFVAANESVTTFNTRSKKMKFAVNYGDIRTSRTRSWLALTEKNGSHARI